MNIFYLISILILFATVLLIKKTDKKLNFLSSLVITIIAFLCYQPIVSYFMDLARIPITLLSMGIINIVVSIILWCIIIFKIKKFQKYMIKMQDIIFLIIMLAINLPILYKEFGALQNFRYISTDASMHCQAAITFSKSDFLLDSMQNWEAVNPTFMIGGYVNSGMIMKALVNVVCEFNLYKIHMFMDILYYFMIGYTFYLLITSSKRCDSKLKYILAYIVSIIFMIGYPLNSVITGFHYFTLGILEFIAIIYVIKVIYIENEGISWLLLFLLNTAIMLTYNLFAPIIYLAEFIYFIYKRRQEKEKIFSKKFILKIIITLVIPGIIGVSFFIIPRIFDNIVLGHQQQLWVNGYIYINYWSNMILFVVFAIYYIIANAIDNKIDFETITFFVLCCFMVIFLLGLGMRYVSTYYFMKLYYLLNCLLLILFFKALLRIIDTEKMGKIFSVLTCGTYVLLLVLNLIFVNVGAYEFEEYNESPKKMFDIYNSNKSIMRLIQGTFPDDRMDTFKYIYENDLIEGQNLLCIGNYVDDFNFRMFFEYENRGAVDVQNEMEHIQKWNKGEYEYLVIFSRKKYLNIYSSTLELSNSKPIFESENCIIYEYLQ